MSDQSKPALPARKPRALLNRLADSRIRYLAPGGRGPQHRPLSEDAGKPASASWSAFRKDGDQPSR